MKNLILIVFLIFLLKTKAQEIINFNELKFKKINGIIWAAEEKNRVIITFDKIKQKNGLVRIKKIENFSDLETILSKEIKEMERKVDSLQQIVEKLRKDRKREKVEEIKEEIEVTKEEIVEIKWDIKKKIDTIKRFKKEIYVVL